MRILFIGSTKRGFAATQAIVNEGYEVAGVISIEQHEHESDRFEVEFKTYCDAKGIPHYQTRFFKELDYGKLLKHQIPSDIGIVVGCRILLPDSILSAPARGCFGVHDSLLPKYRGFAPLNWAIINGEKKTGVTLFHIEGETDTGDIILQKSFKIGPTEFADNEIFEKCIEASVKVVVERFDFLKLTKPNQLNSCN